MKQFFFLQKGDLSTPYPLTRFFLILIILSGFFAVSAQPYSNYREGVYAVSDTLIIDSLSILPHSLKIFVNDTEITREDYRIHYSESKLSWVAGKKPASDSIHISYRVFPLLFSKEYFHKDISKIEVGEKGAINPFTYTIEKRQEDFLFVPGLSKQGSISRGISFGNNQDLSVNSNLNLQLAGKLSDNIQVLAAITDDNIPIQPEGNTQQLQEFDQVYIQLYNEKARLTAGDFQLRSNESYFMKYFKKARGVSVELNPWVADTLNASHITASAAVSRGKFARNIIQGVEGNQGPYRLKGAENENFIIILSGTERVYIDGQLLLRGQENDYVIDYNSAELTFTARRLITKDRRIIVEFQYSDKNYARSLFRFSDEYQSEKLKLRFGLYAEQDSKNQPLQLDLSEDQKILLSQVGDSVQEAISPNIQKVGFSDTEVRYKKTDSLGYDSVFVHSTHTDSAIYRLGFSNVGQGMGNYIQVASSANGRVFQWVAPDTVNGLIVLNGVYEPVILLVTPKKKQMGMVGGEYAISKNTSLFFELAGSNNDINTFSERDRKNDQGYAGKFRIENKVPLNNRGGLQEGDTLPEWKLVTSAGYEKVDKNFSFIEWFRSPEFDRDWNLRNTRLSSSQHIPEGAIGIEKPGLGHIKYQFNAYVSEPAAGQIKNEFKGYKNSILSNVRTKKYDFNFNGSMLQSELPNESTRFLRNKSNLARKFSYFTIGGRSDVEKNLFTNLAKDSLLPGTYGFFEWEVFLSNADTAKNKYILSYDQRKDYAIKTDSSGGVSLKESTHGEFISFSYDILKNENSKIRGKTTYRELTITDHSITSQKPDNTLLNRVEYSLRLLKGAVSLSSFYEIGSGMEVKKEFSYIEVPAGQGVYAWNDYNSNGIKELNEFEISAFPDQARYIKIFIPTSELVKTYTNQFNQSVYLQPSAIWNNKTGMKKLIARFSNQLAYRIDRKTTRENQQSAYNPFIENVADTNLVTLNSSLRNTFYFNRTHPKFGVDLNYQDSKNKTLFTNGFETRKNISREISIRWNMSTDFLLNLVSGDGVKSNRSEFFTNRNFLITLKKMQPKITFQPGTSYRVAVSYEYAEKNNHMDYGGEKSVQQKMGLEVRVNAVEKGSLLSNVNFISINYNGATNSSLAFEMLEGLLPGNNITWTVSYQQTLANNLQVSLNYNGRTAEKTKAVHSGGVQVRAFF